MEATNSANITKKSTRKKNSGIKKILSGRVKLIITVLSFISASFTCFKAYEYYRTPNIAGEWYLTLKVESSTYHAYVGDVIGIKAFLTQKDNSVTGHGEKWDYRGQPLPYSQRRKLEFDGSLKWRKFKTDYILHGETAETTGIIEVEITDGGTKMNGTFAGTAADTKGTITGEKITK